MTSGFQAMAQVRSAYQVMLSNAGDAGAMAAFIEAHNTHQATYVEAFEVGGVSYPRTDGHKLSEQEARAAISRLLASGYSALDLRPSVVEAAYPLAEEALRQEVEAAVRLAEGINQLNWRSETLDAERRQAIRELLRMPTLAGRYQDLKHAKEQARANELNPMRGFDADHLIPDKVLRGALSRDNSATLEQSFAHFMQDSQNRGSQHRFVTDAQRSAAKVLRGDHSQPAQNPTMGAYLERAFKWMEQVYVTADLGVDIAIKSSWLSSRDDFNNFSVKGFALAQAGFMTWRERQEVGRAVATALMIEAREFYTAAGLQMEAELPLFQDLSVSAAQAPVPNLGGSI
ncbi:hypothetical protein KUT89_28050 [Pseudomonas aeruginosa]|nr:hypothetical protein [Pseudomonas aeruginosa]